MYKVVPEDKRESIASYMMPTHAYKDFQGFNEVPTSNGVLSDMIHGPRVQVEEDFAEKKFMPTKGGDLDVTPCFAWLRKPIDDEVCLVKGRRGVIEDKVVSEDDGIQKHDMIAEEDMGVIEEIKDVGFCVPEEDPLAEQEEIFAAYQEDQGGEQFVEEGEPMEGPMFEGDSREIGNLEEVEEIILEQPLDMDSLSEEDSGDDDQVIKDHLEMDADIELAMASACEEKLSTGKDIMDAMMREWCSQMVMYLLLSRAMQQVMHTQWYLLGMHI